MNKQSQNSNPKFHQIMDDLDAYLDFCKDYGYKFDEATLYDMRNYAYQQFSKFQAHKNFKDQWAEDARKLQSDISFE